MKNGVILRPSLTFIENVMIQLGLWPNLCRVVSCTNSFLWTHTRHMNFFLYTQKKNGEWCFQVWPRGWHHRAAGKAGTAAPAPLISMLIQSDTLWFQFTSLLMHWKSNGISQALGCRQSYGGPKWSPRRWILSCLIPSTMRAMRGSEPTNGRLSACLSLCPFLLHSTFQRN